MEPTATSPPAPSLTDRDDSSPLAILLINRLGLFLIAYLSLALIPGSSPPLNAFPGNLFLDGWARWDSHWYAQIARHGYLNRADPSSGQRDTNFFPAYPIAMRGVSILFGRDVYLAGIAISNVAFIAAALLLHRLIAERFDRETAWRAIVLLSV